MNHPPKIFFKKPLSLRKVTQTSGFIEGLNWFVVVEAGIETGGWKPEPRVSRASIDTSPGAPGTTLNEIGYWLRASTTLNDGHEHFRHFSHFKL